MKTTKFKDYQNEIVELRRYFHAHPELSLKEYSTADYIEKYLNKNGIVTKRIGECGITAVIHSGNPGAKVIAVRAEMDAIAVKEENDIDSLFKSGGTSALLSQVSGLADFELICFLVVRNEE